MNTTAGGGCGKHWLFLPHISEGAGSRGDTTLARRRDKLHYLPTTVVVRGQMVFKGLLGKHSVGLID